MIAVEEVIDEAEVIGIADGVLSSMVRSPRGLTNTPSVVRERAG